ncbi:MAG: cation transporter [Clostridiales bacterium]|nr:cation transporter [Clostridiales bacterium]
MTSAFRIRNLGCASCAAKMEKRICALPGVKTARVNFLTQRLTLEADDQRMPELAQQAADIIRRIEPDAKLMVPAR